MRIITVMLGVLAFLAGLASLAYAFLLPNGITLPVPRAADEVTRLLGQAGIYTVASHYATLAVACFVLALLCAYVERGLSEEP